MRDGREEQVAVSVDFQNPGRSQSSLKSSAFMQIGVAASLVPGAGRRPLGPMPFPHRTTPIKNRLTAESNED
jgi:hypothetical protein